MKVLLLDAHTVQSISVARSLKEKGHEVSGFIESKMSYGYVSRYIDHKIISPVVLDSFDVYMDFLVEYLTDNPQDVIIPMYNDSAELLSCNKELIEKRFGTRCAIPKYDTFIKAHDKEKLMDICKEYGFPHPRTAYLCEEKMDEVADYVGFPALIKPNISSGARGIVIVRNEQELQGKFTAIEREFGRCTLQQYVDHTGIYYNVMLYRDSQGKCHESVVIKIMRYFPLKGGTSCYCETVRFDSLVDICGKVLDALDWVGFADFDIMESKSGEFKIIEINPRVPASIHAAYISGVDYPEMIVNDLNGLLVPSYDYQSGKSLRFWGLDVMWFLFSPLRFAYRPSWFNFFGKNVFYQDGSLRDPLPMLTGCLQGVLKYMNPQFRKDKLSDNDIVNI